jgi:exosortase H (IPTLxxWG-CTERM-specific)
MAARRSQDAPGPTPPATGFPARRIVVVALVFIGLACLFHVGLTSAWTWDHFIRPYNGWLARLSAAILGPFVHAPIITDGTRFGTSKFDLVLISGCDGFEAMGILVAGILAFPAPWKSRGFGFLVGLPTIFLANLFRIVVLFLIGLRDKELFEILHVHVFQVFIVGIAAGCFFWWAWRLGPTGMAKPPQPVEDRG